MLDQKKLNDLRDALPKDGYQRVADKTGYDKSTVGRVLRKPTYYNKIIIDAAIEVVKEFRNELKSIEDQIQRVTS